MRPLPSDFEHHSIGALGHLRDRSCCVRERFFPSFARLDDLIGTLDFALGRELFVHGIRAQRRLESLPVSRATPQCPLSPNGPCLSPSCSSPITLASNWPGFRAE